MKKIYKGLIIGFSFSAMLFSSCSNGEYDNKEYNKIDILDNIIVDIKDTSESYRYLKGGEIKNLDLESQGILKDYSDTGNIAIFLEYHDEGKRLNIRSEKELKSIEVKGEINLLELNSNGETILIKTTGDTTSEYKTINTKSLKEVVIPENIAISGELIRFLDDETLVFYGVDLENNDCGIFTYNIKGNTYSLLKEIKQSFISYLDVLDNENILLSKSSNGENKLVLLNLKTLKLVELGESFSDIDTAKKYDDYIFLSAFENGDYNLYRIDINKSKIKRITFDFPKSLGRDAGFIIENEKVYFSDTSGKLYFYDLENESVNILSRQNGINMIIDK